MPLRSVCVYTNSFLFKFFFCIPFDCSSIYNSHKMSTAIYDFRRNQLGFNFPKKKKQFLCRLKSIPIFNQLSVVRVWNHDENACNSSVHTIHTYIDHFHKYGNLFTIIDKLWKFCSPQLLLYDTTNLSKRQVNQFQK